MPRGRPKGSRNLKKTCPVVSPEVRAAVAAFKRQTAPPPYPGLALEIWQDEPSGWRTWIIVAVGHKWITLFSASSLHTWKVKVKDWATTAHRCYETVKPAVLQVLKRNTAQYDLLGIQYSITNAKLASKLIRKWKGQPCSISSG